MIERESQQERLEDWEVAEAIMAAHEADAAPVKLTHRNFYAVINCSIPVSRSAGWGSAEGGPYAQLRSSRLLAPAKTVSSRTINVGPSEWSNWKMQVPPLHPPVPLPAHPPSGKDNCSFWGATTGLRRRSTAKSC